MRQHLHAFQASAISKILHRGSNFALVNVIVHEKPQMEICKSWHNCPWQYFRSFDCVVLIIFICCSTCILEKIISEIVDIFSRAALGLSFHKHMWKRPNVSFQLRQCFIDPWIPTVLFLIITVGATSPAHVTWQFAGGILLIPSLPVILISTDFIPPMSSKYNV